MLAGDSRSPETEAALEKLCRSYWKPLYAYVRRQGHGPHDAQDLTQEFFARLLGKDYLKLASQERGKFRSFLLKSLQHFLINEWVRGKAQKRGGGEKPFSLDEAAAEHSYLGQAAEQLPAEILYDKRWAMTLLERAMERLRADYSTTGRQALFDELKPVLLTEGTAESYRQIGERLGLSDGAAKVAVHRLRQRFRDVIRLEVAQTVASPDEVDEELHFLLKAMSA